MAPKLKLIPKNIPQDSLRKNKMEIDHLLSSIEKKIHNPQQAQKAALILCHWLSQARKTQK
jgi:hypothetical protein